MIRYGFLIPVAFLKIVWIPFDEYQYIPFFLPESARVRMLFRDMAGTGNHPESGVYDIV